MEAARYLDSVLTGVTGCDVEHATLDCGHGSVFSTLKNCALLRVGAIGNLVSERGGYRPLMRPDVFIGICSRAHIAFTAPTATIRRGRWYCSTPRSRELDTSGINWLLVKNWLRILR